MRYILLLLTLFTFNALSDETITLSFNEVTQFTDNSLIPPDDHKGYKVYVNGDFLTNLTPDQLTYSQSYPNGIYVFTVTSIATVEGQDIESLHSEPATKTLPTKIPKQPTITVTVTVIVN